MARRRKKKKGLRGRGPSIPLTRPRRQHCVTPASATVDYAPSADDCFDRVTDARKELSKEVQADLKKCRRRHGRCSQVGTARDGVVEVRIGGRQGHHMFSRWAIRKKNRRR